MISKPFKVILTALLIATTFAVSVIFHLENNRLRRRVAEAQRQQQKTTVLEHDNRRTRELLRRSELDEADGVRAIHTEVMRIRDEVSALEKHADEARAKMLTENLQDDQSLAQNRNPELGLVRLENFENVGRSSPATAFQTFVWAAMKGGDQVVESMIFVTGSAREKAEAIIAALPEADRKSHGTPEKLAALFMANAFTSMAAVQIVDVSLPDAQRATITVRGLANKEQKVPMQLSAQGWQMVIPDQMVEAIGRWAQTRPARNK